MQKDDVIYRQAAIDALKALAVPLHLDSACEDIWERDRTLDNAIDVMRGLPSAEPDYTELKREFILIASYIEVLLECSDEQKETLMGFISRLSEYMPWTKRD